MGKPMVLVDKKDKVLGFKEKFATHKIPVPLHRAISVVIFNGDKSNMLITKRSKKKPTWGGIWSNAVCSHPFPDEDYQNAAERRVKEELGIKVSLKEVSKFRYQAEMDNKVWGENEHDAIFAGKFEGKLHPDPEEIDGYEWIDIKELKHELKTNPGRYTPWFKIIIRKLKI